MKTEEQISEEVFHLGEMIKAELTRKGVASHGWRAKSIAAARTFINFSATLGFMPRP